jgi:Fic family protein
MKSLDIEFLRNQAVPIEMGGLLQKLGEYKGRQDVFQNRAPQLIESLRQSAIIESVESSNRIEGISVPPKRFKELMAHPTEFNNRSEAEIIGYREILSKIHTDPDAFQIGEKTIREFHRYLFSRTDIPGGEWKKRDNTIEERLPDGNWVTRFVPVSSAETPFYIKELCSRFNRLMDNRQVSPLILIPAFVFDFLCIHPFADGNGRVSRLLTVLLLNQSGWTVGKYVSLERMIEESKESYYGSLRQSSVGWHDGKHNLKPWWEFSLGTLLGAYQEFGKRIDAVSNIRGAKTARIIDIIENLPATFSISDIEKRSPAVSRDMIRVVLNRLRSEGKIESSGTGRGAVWEKRGNKTPKRGNKGGNN